MKSVDSSNIGKSIENMLIKQLCEWVELVQKIRIINSEVLPNRDMNKGFDNKALFSHRLEFMEVYGNYRHKSDVF